MDNKTIFSSFTNNLFWDVYMRDLDMEKYSSFIISRVLEYGRWEDWKIIVKYYGIEIIVDVCKQLRSLDPRLFVIHLHLSHPGKKDSQSWHTRQYYPTLWNS